MKTSRLLSLNIPLFEGLSEQDLEGLDLTVRYKSFSAWQTVFSSQDTSRDVYFVLSGALVAVYWTSDGREVVFSRLMQGAYLGELAALTDRPRTLSVVARGPSRVLILHQSSFAALIDGNRILRWRILRDLAARIATLTDRCLQLTTMSVEQRVHSYLLRYAMERGGLCSGHVLRDTPTHAEIAASIGATREMVSRTLSRLTADGVIRSARQRIEILDPERLVAGS
jgi:CRP-like cAMP-binding protein